VFDKTQAKTPDAAEQREVARGLVDGLSHEQARQLADSANGKAMLDSARTELAADAGDKSNQAAITRIDAALKAAELKNSAEFKKLDPATQKAALEQISQQQANPAAVDNTIALVKSPGFQAASPATRGELLAAQQQQAQDPILREGLEKLAADPAFQKMTPAQQATAIHAISDLAKSETYQGKEGSWFFNMGAKSVSDADKRAMLDNTRQVVTSTGFNKAGADTQQAMLDALRPNATDATLTGSLVKLMDDVAAKSVSNPALMKDVTHLLATKDFKDLDGAAKTAVLSQVRNYPDSKVANNLERLIGKDWFKDFDAGDKQRALKLIAYMSNPGNAGDPKIVNNTLEKFLAKDAPYKLELVPITSKPGNVTFGQAANGVMTINEDLVGANNNKLETDTYGRKLSIDTVPHEINHLINDDKVAQTFDYLNEEYRAWYVGRSADLGRPPSNQEALERWAYFVDPNSGYYDSAAKGALADPAEAAKIFSELSQLTGLKVDGSNYQKIIAELAADPTKYKTNPNAAAAVVPPGNLDNH
jgi:hypothetical protein